MRKGNHRIGTPSTGSELHLWHHRLGRSNQIVGSSMTTGKRYGMHLDDPAKSQDRMVCTHAEPTRNRFDGNLMTKRKPVTIYAVICGPMRTSSCGGNRYFLVMTTGEQKYVRMHFRKSRSVLKSYFGNSINWIEQQSRKKVGVIHINNVPSPLRCRRNLEGWV